MLLLILFAGCLSLCAAQTTSLPFVLPTEFPSDSQPLPAGNAVAILQAAVRSTQELNETTIGPVLSQLFGLIQQLEPGTPFSLSVKNITQV